MAGKLLLILQLCIVLTSWLTAIASASDTQVKGELIFEKSNTCVIFLHGLGRKSDSFNRIESAFSDIGFRVHNKSYPSTLDTIQKLTTSHISTALAWCRSRTTPHIAFVTHSLGGILVRQFFQNQTISEKLRIVMLSPPNQGSEVVDLLRDVWLFKNTMGPAGLQLGTDSESVPFQLEQIGGEIGIITGYASSDPWFSPFIPGPDDGKVSVESAKLKEMKAFLVVPRGHTFIMQSPGVIKQVLYFIQNGRFIEEDLQY
ncbi:MAG: triacylglycerol lipase [Parasphingorhabdus sp.]|jgi:triacylglycerol lipase